MAKQVINTGTVANDGTGDGLRTAFTKVNSNFTELYSQTSNSWVSPQTSNTYNVIQVFGATRVTLPAPNTATINSVSNRTGTAYEVYILKNPTVDAILQPIWDGDIDTSGFTIFVGANSSDAFITTYNSNEWVILFDSQTRPTYTANVTNVDISITYTAEPQPWFDPAALGYTDFRGARLDYHAYVDNVQGFNRIGTVTYVAADDYYNTNDNGYNGSNSTQDVDLNIRRNTDKLHYRNNSAPAGNLHIQWSGVVFTGRDRQVT